jgi:hypothetical protein
MTAAKKRIRAALNSLALMPIRTRAMRPTPCSFCTQPIQPGTQYRRASNIDAHETCFQAVAHEYRGGSK